MANIGKVGMAVVMALTLSLTLLASGTFAQDTTVAQHSTSATQRVASLTVDRQQETFQVLPTSYQQQFRTARSNRWGGWGYCRPYRYRYSRFYRPTRYYRHHYGGYRCFWVRRGWGWRSRMVRICHRW